MAIIDTSKGVRPVVEELSWLENNKTRLVGYDIKPLFSPIDTPNVYKQSQSKNGITVNYNGDNTFTVNGTNSTNVTNITLSDPIPFDNPIIMDGNDIGSYATYNYIEPIALVPFYSISNLNQKIASGILFRYTTADSAQRSLQNLVPEYPTIYKAAILKDRFPILDTSINLVLTVNGIGTVLDNVIIGLYVYRLSDYGFDAIETTIKTKGKLPESARALGFVDTTNTLAQDYYFNSKGINVINSNGIKYYYDTE